MNEQKELTWQQVFFPLTDVSKELTDSNGREKACSGRKTREKEFGRKSPLSLAKRIVKDRN